MDTMRHHLALFSLLSLTSFAIGARQAGPNTDRLTMPQAGSPSPTSTADGVPSCSDKDKTPSLPEGVNRVGGGLLPPVPTKIPQAKFADESRKYARRVMKTQHLRRFDAKNLVRLTVDTNGFPREMCVLNELGHGFDRRALDAAAEYRFKPATRDGEPVPVRLTIEVNWALW